MFTLLLLHQFRIFVYVICNELRQRIHLETFLIIKVLRLLTQNFNQHIAQHVETRPDVIRLQVADRVAIRVFFNHARLYVF